MVTAFSEKRSRMGKPQTRSWGHKNIGRPDLLNAEVLGLNTEAEDGGDRNHDRSHAMADAITTYTNACARGKKFISSLIANIKGRVEFF